MVATRLLSPLFILLLCTCGRARLHGQETITLDVRVDTICFEDEITARVTGETYLWSTGQTTAAIAPSASGPYAVTITQANGDVTVDPREVEVFRDVTPVLPVASPAPPYCPGQLVTYSVNLTGYDSIQWLDGLGTIYEPFSEGDNEVTVSAFPGVFVTYMARYGVCRQTVSVLPPLGFTEEDFGATLTATIEGIPDTALCPGDSLTLSVTGTAITGVAWEDGDTSRVRTVVADDTAGYTVTVFSPCDTTAVLTADFAVRDCTPPSPEPPFCRAVFPELITPNGDGTNDLFRLFTACPPVEFNLRIFNRWGQTVFTSDDADRGWDGTNAGNPQNQDIYLYLVRYRLDGADAAVEEGGQFALIR